MRGDFSRKTHRPDRHYSRVLLQQGRVLLDADWNEQTAIQLQTMRTMMSDLIGPHGGPSDALAFMVETSTSDTGKLVLEVGNGFANLKEFEPIADRLRFQDRNVGRYYVDGIMVEHDLSKSEDGALILETDIDAGNDAFVIVYLEVWEQHVTWIEENKPFKQRSMREIALGGPDTCSRAQVCWAIKTQVVPTRIAESLGRLSDGNANEISIEDGQNKLMQLWARKRFATLAQLGVRMAAGLTTQDIGAGDPCRDTAVARYRGPENRLYRVEIHSIVDDAPAFKWSRENGSVVFPIAVDEPISFDEGELTLALRVSSDPRFGLDKGDIVELVTEASDAAGQAGPMFEVESVDPTAPTVRLRAIDKRTIELPLEKWALLRRWDHLLDSKRSNGAPAQMRDGAIVIDGRDEFVLEDGIVVRFLLPELGKKIEAPTQPTHVPLEVTEGRDEVIAVEGERARALTHGFGSVSLEPSLEKVPSSCRVGDYWLIPARTIPGDVEWPKIDESMEAFELPHGIERHYAPLATIRIQDGSIRVDDLRRRFDGLAR